MKYIQLLKPNTEIKRKLQLRSPGGSSLLPRDVATAPTADMVLLAAGERGLFRSDDAGLTWVSRIDAYPGADVLGVAINPTSTDTWVLTSSTGIWRTTNAGLQWTKVKATTTSVWRVAFSSDGTRAYAGSGIWLYRNRERAEDIAVTSQLMGRTISSGPAVIYFSSDAGVAWTAISPVDTPSLQVGGFAIDPSNALRVWATIGHNVTGGAQAEQAPLPGSPGWRTGVHLIASKNGGVSWEVVTSLHEYNVAAAFGIDISSDGKKLAVATAMPSVLSNDTVYVEGQWADVVFIGDVPAGDSVQATLQMFDQSEGLDRLPSGGEEYKLVSWDNRASAAGSLIVAAANPTNSTGEGLYQTSQLTSFYSTGNAQHTGQQGWDPSRWISTSMAIGGATGGNMFVTGTTGLYMSQESSANTLSSLEAAAAAAAAGVDPLLGGAAIAAAAQVVWGNSDCSNGKVCKASKAFPYAEKYSLKRPGQRGSTARGWDAGEYTNMAVGDGDESSVFLCSKRQLGFISFNKGTSWSYEKPRASESASETSCMSRTPYGGEGGSNVHTSVYTPAGYKGHSYVDQCTNSTVILDRSLAATFTNTSGTMLLLGAGRTDYNGSFEEGGLYARLQNGTYILVAGGKTARNGLAYDEEVTMVAADNGHRDNFFVGTDKGHVYIGTGAQNVAVGMWGEASLKSIGPAGCLGKVVDGLRMWPNASRVLLSCTSKIFHSGGASATLFTDPKLLTSSSWTEISSVGGVTLSSSLLPLRLSGCIHQGTVVDALLKTPGSTELMIVYSDGLIYGRSLHTTPVYAQILTETQAKQILGVTGGSLQFTDVVGMADTTYIVSVQASDSINSHLGNGLILVNLTAAGGTATFPDAFTSIGGDLGSKAPSRLIASNYGERVFVVTSRDGVWEWTPNLLSNGGFERQSSGVALQWSESTNSLLAASDQPAMGTYAQTMKASSTLTSTADVLLDPVPMRITGWIKNTGPQTATITLSLMYWKDSVALRHVYVPIPAPTTKEWTKWATTFIPDLEATHVKIILNGTKSLPVDNPGVKVHYGDEAPTSFSDVLSTLDSTNSSSGRRTTSGWHSSSRRNLLAAEPIQFDHLWIGKATDDLSSITGAESQNFETSRWPLTRQLNSNDIDWADVPGPPSKPAMMPNGLVTRSTTTASIAVQWYPGYNGNGAVYFYQLFYQQQGSTNWTLGATVPGQQYFGTVPNLYRATLYFIKVLAVNQVGPGSLSEPLGVMTNFSRPNAPGQPVLGKSTDPLVPASTGTTTSTLTFDVPAPLDLGGLPLQYFTLHIEEAGVWRGNLTIMHLSEVKNTTTVPGLVLHDGAGSRIDGTGWYPATYQITLLRLLPGTTYRLKLSATNAAGTSDMSAVSEPATTGIVKEPAVVIRLLYDSLVLSDPTADGSTIIDDSASSWQLLNSSFRKEWCLTLSIPTNQMFVATFSTSYIIRLLKKTNYIAVNFTLLSTSSTTDQQQDEILASMRQQITNQDSNIHKNGLINRRLDWGYYKIYHTNTTEEYVWQLQMAPEPTDRLSAGVAIFLGLVVFWFIPAAVAAWLPFYYAKIEEGYDNSKIFEMTLAMWYAACCVYYKHAQVMWKRFTQTKAGKKLVGMCGKKKKMKPEDIDPTTGLPYGFDPKYFPDGMPPEAMAKYEASLRPKDSAE